MPVPSRFTFPTNEHVNRLVCREGIRSGPSRDRRESQFPELGYGRLRVFTGVQEEVLETARHREFAADQERAARQTRPLVEGAGVEANTSIGPDGTCLVIEGL
jgi:hypothetical protein